jgi:hypothetical protein
MMHQTKSAGACALIVAVLFLSGAGRSSGAAFRLSFLEDKAALADTCRLLKQRGFSEGSVASFEKLVEHHNRNGNRVDKTRFPTPRDGSYEFNDLGDFTNRTRTPFAFTPSDHSPAQDTFTCFDAACLLLHGAGCGAPDFEKDLTSRGLVFSKGGPKGFRAAYSSLLFPEPGYKRLVGKPRPEAETQLLYSIRATRGVSGDPMSQEAWRSAFATWVRGLKEAGFVFPREFKLGMGFSIYPRQRYLCPGHIFLCFPQDGRLICLQKEGSPGPYVRVEFKSQEDMARYMCWPKLEQQKDPKLQDAHDSPALISLNDQLIAVYAPGTQQ